jgi:hydroxymethylpyrimidine/phosphomethylpyrimidine kinase
MSEPSPVALSIAGSDSSGGAGIQADLKTFHAHGVFGTTAITAVTAQNTLGVASVLAVPDGLVRAQVEAVVHDMRPDAVKTGMLATAALVEVVAAEIASRGLANYVLDPVMVATSGARLLDRDAEASVARLLVPLASVVTPNLHEAAILVGREMSGLDDMRMAVRALVDMGAASALVKGGHLQGDAIDVFWDGDEERLLRNRRLDTRHTHGTGCTLSAAICSRLARGEARVKAVDGAVAWVHRAIATAPGLGRGSGPVNHFAPVD